MPACCETFAIKDCECEEEGKSAPGKSCEEASDCCVTGSYCDVNGDGDKVCSNSGSSNELLITALGDCTNDSSQLGDMPACCETFAIKDCECEEEGKSAPGKSCEEASDCCVTGSYCDVNGDGDKVCINDGSSNELLMTS